MFKKFLVSVFTGLLLLSFTVPVFASTSNTQNSTIADRKPLPDVFNPEKQYLIPQEFYASGGKDKQFTFPDGSNLKISVEKSEEIPLTPENKEKLISITGDRLYVDNLYAKKSSQSTSNTLVAPVSGSVLKPNSVIYQTIWVSGSAVFTTCKYQEDIVLDGNYGSSRITYIYPESYNIFMVQGSYNTVVGPVILNYQQSGTNPATSYLKYAAHTIDGNTYTCTLESYVRDANNWATFTH
jgi:hypothetical protein